MDCYWMGRYFKRVNNHLQTRSNPCTVQQSHTAFVCCWYFRYSGFIVMVAYWTCKCENVYNNNNTSSNSNKHEQKRKRTSQVMTNNGKQQPTANNQTNKPQQQQLLLQRRPPWRQQQQTNDRRPKSTTGNQNCKRKRTKPKPPTSACFSSVSAKQYEFSGSFVRG